MIGIDGRVDSSDAQLTFGSNSLGMSVRTMTGDHILGQISEPLAIIKIDADGNEFDVLHGFKKSFEKI
jgi:FkbM family methyltransferase